MFYIHTKHTTGLMPGDTIKFLTCKKPKQKRAKIFYFYICRGDSELSFGAPDMHLEVPFNGKSADFHEKAQQIAEIFASVAGAYLVENTKMDHSNIWFTVIPSNPS